jgi:hypothetical protein
MIVIFGGFLVSLMDFGFFKVYRHSRRERIHAVPHGVGLHEIAPHAFDLSSVEVDA